MTRRSYPLFCCIGGNSPCIKSESRRACILDFGPIAALQLGFGNFTQHRWPTEFLDKSVSRTRVLIGWPDTRCRRHPQNYLGAFPFSPNLLFCDPGEHVPAFRLQQGFRVDTPKSRNSPACFFHTLRSRFRGMLNVTELLKS